LVNWLVVARTLRATEPGAQIPVGHKILESVSF
jgi:hypothetical protein